MCGIIGILGRGDVTNRVIEGLSRLEYRGYDSAGIAVMDARGRIEVRRAPGKLAALTARLREAPVAGSLGIGHTRWATHGPASEINAHPHRTRNVTLVHNGIIENHAELRHALEGEGVVFSSDTDTEVAAQLLERHLATSRTLDEAFARLLDRLVGSYALAVIFEGYPDLIFAARQGSPLAIGYGEMDADGTAEMVLGSDALALAPFTERVSYLEDGDWAIIRPDRVRITDRRGREVTREIVTVPAGTWSADKGPYRHYMLKEIHDQPQSLARLLSGLVDSTELTLKPFLPGLAFSEIDKITLVACGTAHYACHLAQYWFEEIAGIDTAIEIASEYRYRTRVHRARELVIAVSQSGETADTLAALHAVRDRVASRLAIVNVASSSLAREAEHVLDIAAGPEIGVASTKAFTGQLLALLALAAKAGLETGRLDAAGQVRLVQELVGLPRLVLETIALEPRIRKLAYALAPARDVLFLGRGRAYPIALEAALKLKEISYIHAEGYAAGELKHGPIALIDRETPVVVFDSTGALQDKTLSNAAEVVARGATLWHVGPEASRGIVTPECAERLLPFAQVIVAQMLAYQVAFAKGTDVDQPRNLAKSVTVE